MLSGWNNLGWDKADTFENRCHRMTKADMRRAGKHGHYAHSFVYSRFCQDFRLPEKDIQGFQAARDKLNLSGAFDPKTAVNGKSVGPKNNI